MRFASFVERLRNGLATGPPGVDGQLPMAPRPRFGWQPGAQPAESRSSAALALWYPLDDRPHLLLTVRDSRLLHHGGQVSLPGGGVERGESLEQAALREAEEEVGLDPASVTIVGPLSPLHVPVSGYVVHPWCAVAERRPSFDPDPREVARLLEADLELLCDPTRLSVEPRTRRGVEVLVPSFEVDGCDVWGATAMIVCELLTALGMPPDPWAAGPGRPAGQRWSDSRS